MVPFQPYIHFLINEILVTMGDLVAFINDLGDGSEVECEYDQSVGMFNGHGKLNVWGLMKVLHFVKACEGQKYQMQTLHTKPCGDYP